MGSIHFPTVKCTLSLTELVARQSIPLLSSCLLQPYNSAILRTKVSNNFLDRPLQMSLPCKSTRRHANSSKSQPISTRLPLQLAPCPSAERVSRRSRPASLRGASAYFVVHERTSTSASVCRRSLSAIPMQPANISSAPPSNQLPGLICRAIPPRRSSSRG